MITVDNARSVNQQLVMYILYIIDFDNFCVNSLQNMKDFETGSVKLIHDEF
jgi:hypothetical protein